MRSRGSWPSSITTLNFPPLRSTCTSGHDELLRHGSEGAGGTRIERAYDLCGAGDVPGFHSQPPRNVREPVPRQIIEVRRYDPALQAVLPPAALELDQQALPQILRTDSGRIEALHDLLRFESCGRGMPCCRLVSPTGAERNRGRRGCR